MRACCRHLPDSASPIVKALVVQDYEEVKRLLDEVAGGLTRVSHKQLVNQQLVNIVRSSQLASARRLDHLRKLPQQLKQVCPSLSAHRCGGSLSKVLQRELEQGA